MFRAARLDASRELPAVLLILESVLDREAQLYEQGNDNDDAQSDLDIGFAHIG